MYTEGMNNAMPSEMHLEFLTQIARQLCNKTRTKREAAHAVAIVLSCADSWMR